MIQLIASDIDGTLLQGRSLTLDPHIFELICRLKEKGIRFAAASGRQYYSLRALFEPVKDDISYIAENGSLCIHNHEVLSRGKIDRDLSLRILDSIYEYRECECIVSCESKIYTDGTDEKFLSQLTDYLNYDIEIVKDLREIKEDFLKIAVFNSQAPQAMRDHFTRQFKEEIKVVSSAKYWVDFIAPNANKGTALAGLLNHFQIDPVNCIAFGDQYNDVEMLQFAGTSYAMANAAPGISYYSTYVTDSVQEVLEDILAQIEIQ